MEITKAGDCAAIERNRFVIKTSKVSGQTGCLYRWQKR
jgi:hypothetical protein